MIKGIGVVAHDFHPRVFRLSLTGEVCDDCQTRGGGGGDPTSLMGAELPPGSPLPPSDAQFTSPQQRRHTVIGTSGRPSLVPGSLLQGLFFTEQLSRLPLEILSPCQRCSLGVEFHL